MNGRHVEPTGALAALVAEWDRRAFESEWETSPSKLVLGMLGTARRRFSGTRSVYRPGEASAAMLARHLDQAQRAELAQQLLVLALQALCTDSEAGRHVLRYTKPSSDFMARVLVPADDDVLRASNRVEEGIRDLGEFAANPIFGNEWGGGSSGVGRASAVTLAQEAQLLEPSGRARGYVGIALILENQFRSSLTTLGPLVTGGRKDAQACVALQNIALAEWRLGRLGRALEHSGYAARWPSAAVAVRFDHLMYALRAEDKQATRQAADLLAEIANPTHPGIQEGVKLMRWLQTAEERALSREKETFALSLLDQLPDTASHAIRSIFVP